jgi:hypothetical protein
MTTHPGRSTMKHRLLSLSHLTAVAIATLVVATAETIRSVPTARLPQFGGVVGYVPLAFIFVVCISVAQELKSPSWRRAIGVGLLANLFVFIGHLDGLSFPSNTMGLIPLMASALLASGFIYSMKPQEPKRTT